MQLQLSENELRRSRDDEKIVRETAQQVIKDFALFGLEVSFPENIHWAYDELFHQLNSHVSQMLIENDRKLLSLLYQIDVPEEKVRNVARKNPDENHSHTITNLILDRELKKVITRNYFKKMAKNNSEETPN